MDDDMKQLRVSFSGVGQQEHQSGREIMAIPSQQSTRFGRGRMSNGDEFDPAYAAMVAAVAYAIAEREEQKLASKETPAKERFASASKRRLTEKFGSQKKPASADERPTFKSPTKRGESLKRPVEGSKISRWLSGKEPVDDDYDDEQGANVSVRRPLKPAQKMPEGTASVDEHQTGPTLKSPTKRGESLKRPIDGSKISRWLSGKEPVDDDYDERANVSVRRPQRPTQSRGEGIGTSTGQNEVDKMIDSAPPSLKKDPSFTRKPTEKKGSRKYEQDQAQQMIPPAAPRLQPTSSYPGRGGRVAPSGMAASSEAEAMADAWEKEKMAKIKKQYNETMETIAEWEAEKKAKARRQKQLKDESDSERKRAKALEEYNDEMSRINKVAAASRLTAEEKRRNAEAKVREKANQIRSTGKLPSTCGCF